MRFLKYDKTSNKFSLTEYLHKSDIPQYAILSHTWGLDTDEVKYRDLVDGTGRDKVGYRKISFCAEQAKCDGLQYFWVDTCCIDKSNSTELQEAINSMFRWYRDAARCYVYLSDVSITGGDEPGQQSDTPWELGFRTSRWFKRGWTLQELLAPKSVKFFTADGGVLGDKNSLETLIHEITGIPILALRGMDLSHFDVRERLKWAETRQTKREEDQAYCLLGIFGVYIPLIYGEGSKNAFRRLMLEVPSMAGRDQVPSRGNNLSSNPGTEYAYGQDDIHSMPSNKRRTAQRTSTSSVDQQIPDSTTALLDRFAATDGTFNSVAPTSTGSPASFHSIEKADAFIRDNCYAAKCLEIERLSGALLPMDRCYINLAIVEQPGEKATRTKPEGKPSPFSLHARLKINTPAEESGVLLPCIFNPRKTRDGHVKQPSRILIRGRAGVGKTTLCKKIVHDFTYNRIWRDLFDRVLWVPLRNLKQDARRNIAGYNLGHLFRDEYFSQHFEGSSLAQVLWRTVEGARRDRTLFILDGLDEVSQDLEGHMLHFFKELLDQPRVIITSRPHVVLPPGINPIDLELETIGFNPDQVNIYIKMAFGNLEMGGIDEIDLEKPREIQAYLREHQLIQSLVRIPIQLDALCYTWDTFTSNSAPQTMTAIYIAIEEGLWKKDIVRLQKRHDGQPITSYHIENLGRDGIESLLEAEIHLLEGLAFTGLYNDIIDFRPEHWKAILRQFTNSNSRVLPDKTIQRLSFLRTSSHSSKEYSCHFLHLTFQEYFAARYFIRQWRAGQNLQYLNLAGITECIKITPKTFLGQHKYSERYDIVWRFSAGMLESDEISRFFNELEQEPIDLLGPAHQRLIIHCLSEVDPSTELPTRPNLESRLLQWLLFECDSTGISFLARESEFPDEVLNTALEASSNHVKLVILRELQNVGRDLSRKITTTLIELLHDKEAGIRALAAETLGKQSTLTYAAITTLIGLLDDDLSVRRSAAEALGQSTLPDAAITALIGLLHNREWDVQSYVAEALGKQLTLPDAAITALIGLLNGKEGEVRSYAAGVLGKQSKLPDAATIALVGLLHDKERNVQSYAARVLGKQSTLPNATITALIGLISDKEWSVQSYAARVLGKQSILPDTTITALIGLLDNTEGSVRSNATRVLGKQSTLQDAAITALTRLLNDDEGSVRSYAAEALWKQSTLPESTIAVLMPLLHDRVEDVRYSATRALGTRSTLPDAAITALIRLLRDKGGSVRSYAAEALGNCSILPDAVVTTLIELLDDEKGIVRSSAAKALWKQSILPDAAITALVGLLHDKEWGVQSYVAEELGKQSTLPDTAITAIIGLLDDEKGIVRAYATKALGKQSTLPDAAITALMRLLCDEQPGVRCYATEALGKQSILPDDAITALIGRLNDEIGMVRSSVTEALGNRSTLPNAAVKGLIGLLDDEEWSVRFYTARALGKQSTLPDAAFTALIGLLREKKGAVQSYVAEALGKRSTLPDAAITALIRLLGDEDLSVRSSAAEALGDQSLLCDKLLTYMGLSQKAYTPAENIRNPEIIEYLYWSFIYRGFRESFSLCIDYDSNIYTINQSRGQRIARHGECNPSQLLAIINKGRRCSNTSEYKLWDDLGGVII
jgi:HEAT repeat protein